MYLNYFKNQNYHKYTHLLQIYVDFSCTDLSHGFHHVNVRHDLLRYFYIDFSFYFLTLMVHCIQNCLKRYFWVGRCISSISIVLTNEVKHVQSNRPCRVEWYFYGGRENKFQSNSIPSNDWNNMFIHKNNC